MDEILAAARARWPQVMFDDAISARHLDECRDDAGQPPPFAAEVVLAAACLAGNAAAIRAFNDEMFERVDRVLSRLGLSAADADDVKQDVRTKLLVASSASGGDPKLALYRGTGPLPHWIASVAGREALGSMRKRKSTDAIDDDDFLADAADDPELVALKAQHGAAFKEAFQAAVRELGSRERGILRALIVDDRSVNEVAAVYGIHRVTASRWVSELRADLLKRTRNQLRDRFQLDASSIESALRMLDSNLELSLYRLLAETKPK
ncbi:MAG: sigma-70 family RNA polymerase sigma factor [Kofleriaceae bacterium]